MKNKKIQLFVIISLLLIVIAIIITYNIINPKVKIPEPEIEEYPVSSSKYIKEQNKKINQIINIFNDEKLIKKYINNYEYLKVKNEGNTIIINYKGNKIEKEYIFILDSDELSITISNKEFELFDKIFKIIVEANQKRLDNNIDFSDYFIQISKHNISNRAISISTKDNINYKYIIHIDKKIVLLND
ncbi:MAG: hypothetical protein VZS44_02345 [Bacilli bacterium]|nr:hypothetical protein [Bacilli bacterium]